MNRSVHVDLGERSYEIAIGTQMAAALSIEGAGTTALVVSDSNVAPLYSDVCVTMLEEKGFRAVSAVVSAGEESKSVEVAAFLYEQCVKAGLDRSSTIVALGGGVVGDLAGFVAATFLRGVRLVQIPTTILSMVDSSVGGKTAVNLPQGKNLVGCFYQPAGVIADLSVLSTLPRREYISGLAEVVKYGVIWDAPFFALLEEHADLLLSADVPLLEDVIARCCEIKADVVAQDERESGMRAILNFGHTLGHAIENVCGYGRWLHGEAVAVGMAYAAGLSSRICGCPAADRDRIIALLRRLELPVNPSSFGDAPAWDRLREAMSSDKKANRQVPRFVLAESMGSVQFGCDVSEEAMRATYDEWPQ